MQQIFLSTALSLYSVARALTHSLIVDSLPDDVFSTPYKAILERGESVVVTTPTSSGKSLIYIVPYLEAYVTSLEEGRADEEMPRALFLFPTKALTQVMRELFSVAHRRRRRVDGEKETFLYPIAL